MAELLNVTQNASLRQQTTQIIFKKDLITIKE